MNDEQFERHKEFMLQQQTQLAAQHTQSVARLAQMEELLVRFAQATRDRFEVADRRTQETDEKITALIDAQVRADDRTAELDRWTKENSADFDRRLTESRADFDRRLKESRADFEKGLKESRADFEKGLKESRADFEEGRRKSRADFERQLKESRADFDRRYALLLESHRMTEETVRRLGERIDNLAATVDRHIAEGHNGKGRG